MSKTAREGAVEIVKAVSTEEWTEMLRDSTATAAEAAAAVAKFAEELSQTLENLADSVSRFRERWAQINFSG